MGFGQGRLYPTAHILNVITPVPTSMGWTFACPPMGMQHNNEAYADDLVLFAPSWYGMQRLLDVLAAH